MRQRRLNEAKVISKFDLIAGYMQAEMDEESRYITTFITHVGLYRYKRLNFGLSSASEIFQKALEQIFAGIEGVKNISDDIIVYGVDQDSHDKALHEALNRIEKSGLTVNIDKCEFSKTEMNFFGLNFSKEGIKLDEKKIQALKQAEPPSNVKELRSLIGLVNYCAKFIKNAADLLAPFRALLRKNAKYMTP